MNNQRSFFVVMGAFLFLTAIISLGNPITIGAAETCNIVTIHGRSGLNAQALSISKGDCVVWMNWTRDEDVVLVFKDHEKCINATDSQQGFQVAKSKGCLVSQGLSYGQTVSLLFTKAGTYDYEVQFKVGGSIDGRIVVRE